MNSMARTYVGQIELKARKEGREEGYHEAYHKAYHEARDEAFQEKIKMVLNMIKDNLPNETISNYSELPLEEIAKIREQYT